MHEKVPLINAERCSWHGRLTPCHANKLSYVYFTQAVIWSPRIHRTAYWVSLTELQLYCFTSAAYESFSLHVHVLSALVTRHKT